MTTRRLTAESTGTFWLVFGGCGAAMFAADPAGDQSVGIGCTVVALGFGLTVLTGVYAFGAISGGHFNPAVTLGAAIAGALYPMLFGRGDDRADGAARPDPAGTVLVGDAGRKR